MKKLLCAILVLAMCAFAFVGCTQNANTDNGDKPAGDDTPADAKVKVGFIFLHDENSTYDLNFMNGAKAACEAQGVDYITSDYPKLVAEAISAK